MKNTKNSNKRSDKQSKVVLKLPKFPRFTNDAKLVKYLNTRKFIREADEYLYLPMFNILNTNRISIYHDMLAIKSMVYVLVEKLGQDEFRILWDMFQFDPDNPESYDMKVLYDEDINYIR